MITFVLPADPVVMTESNMHQHSLSESVLFRSPSVTLRVGGGHEEQPINQPFNFTGI